MDKEELLETLREALHDLRKRRRELTKQIADIDTEMGLIKLEIDKIDPPRDYRK